LRQAFHLCVPAINPVVSHISPERSVTDVPGRNKLLLDTQQHSGERVTDTLVRGFAWTLSLVDITRGGLHGVEIAGECVAD
jgi:hypothetical protein